MSNFDRDKNKGFTICEHVNPKSHYIPRGQTDKKPHATENELIEYHNYVYDKWREQYDKLDEKVERSQYESDYTMLLTMKLHRTYKSPNEITYQFPHVQTILETVDKDKNTSGLTIGTVLEPNMPQSWSVDIGEPCSIGIDVGNDPTPSEANSVVSLGYFNVRIEMFAASLINKNPVTFIGPANSDIIENGLKSNVKNIRVGINRPLRRPSIGE
jgi:hypothetical protein